MGRAGACRAVCACLCAVDGDVFDEKRIDIERFKLGVGFGVSEKFQKIQKIW